MTGYPLEGIKVVEVASMIMAPSCAAVLSDFGAEIIKVESPGRGDNNRYLHEMPGQPKSDIAFCFVQDNRNKKSIVLDLKNPQGMKVLHELLESADVFISNFRQPALKRLGLRYEDIQAKYPRLIYAYASGFGEKGPEANKAAYDMVSYWARSGMESAMYPVDGWLSTIPSGTGDHVSGMTLFAAIMLALFTRQQTGKGCKVGTSLIANGFWTNAAHIQAKLCGAEFRPKRPHDQAYNACTLSYRTKNNDLIKLTIVESEKNWQPFCQAIGREDLTDDSRFSAIAQRSENMSALIAILVDTFSSKSTQELIDALVAHDIPHSRIANYDDVISDVQAQANDLFVELDCGDQENFRTVDSPINSDSFNKVKPKMAPALGENSNQVLSELGYSTEEIQELVSAGVTSSAK